MNVNSLKEPFFAVAALAATSDNKLINSTFSKQN